MGDPEIRPVIEYLNRYLHDLFIITDGGEAIEDTQDGGIYEPGIQTADPDEIDAADTNSRRYALLVD
jgi:hypothetical protein